MSRPAAGIGPSETLVLLGAFLLLILLTEARHQGDTADYAVDALRFGPLMHDFGHLLWTPLGWWLSLPVRLFGADGRWSLLWTFYTLNLLATFGCAWLIADLARRRDAAPGAAVVASLVFLTSHVVLNYAQSGTSYLPGLALVLLAWWWLLADPEHPRPLRAGISLALAVALWFPYVLVLPGLLLAPWMEGRGRSLSQQVRASAAVLLSVSVPVVLGFGTAAWLLGIRDLGGLLEWVREASHGLRSSGVARAALGLARSFVSLGDDGLILKRLVLRDPYHPVGWGELLGLHLLKIALVYLSLAALLGHAWRRGERAFLLLLAGSALPVLTFGFLWQGGDMERYLPAYPLLFVLLARVWSPPRGLGGPLLALALLAGMTNAIALSRAAANARLEALRQRLIELPELPPRSELMVVRDRLQMMRYDFPLSSEARRFSVVDPVRIAHEDLPRWRADFAQRVQGVWDAGGQVWLSRRLLRDTPHAESTWAEGDDPRIRWVDIPAFFRTLETGEAVGGEDGFERLLDSPLNRTLFRRLTPME